MANKGNYYRLYFSVSIRGDNGKTQIVWTTTCENCLSCFDKLVFKEFKNVEATLPLLEHLLQMMSLSSCVVEKKILSNTIIRISVSANHYTYDNIPNLIGTMCSRHVYWNISPEDANEIITRLGLSQYVFCVQGDPESGACLVVLQDLNLEYYDTHFLSKKEPRTTFRDAVQEFNRSRTVVMTSAQRDTLLSDVKPSVEFSSVLPDCQIEVVFRREAIQTVVPEIMKQVEIDNIERRLKELKSSSK